MVYPMTAPDHTTDDLLTEEQAAQRLGLNHRTLAAWRQRRQGPPYVKVGKCVRYRVADLEAFTAAHRVDPGAAVLPESSHES